MTKITSFLMVLLMVPTAIFSQSVITVDNSQGSSAQYSDLQTAINSASSGDIIYVHASENSYGDIIIDKSITLIGYSHSDVQKQSILDKCTLNDNSSNTKITGFRFTDAFLVVNPTNIVSNLIVENNFFEWVIDFGSGSSSNIVDDVIVRGNIFTRGLGNWSKYTNTIISNNVFTGINDLDVLYHQSVTVENNVFIGGSYITNQDPDTGTLNVNDNIFVYHRNINVDFNSTGVLFQNCLTYNDESTVTALSGTGNINDTDPQFVNVTDDIFDSSFDFNLQMGSPAENSGTLGDDIGLFGGNGFVFNNAGFSVGIPIVNITAITSQVTPGGNVEVTIESSSN